MWSKLRRKRESSQIQIEKCPMRHIASRIGRNPLHVHLTEGCVFVAACSTCIARTHAAVLSSCSSRASSQRVGALSLIPFCLGTSGHPSGSRQGHPTVHWGPDQREGRGVARTQFSTAVQCRNTANSFGVLSFRFGVFFFFFRFGVLFLFLSVWRFFPFDLAFFSFGVDQSVSLPSFVSTQSERA